MYISGLTLNKNDMYEITEETLKSAYKPYDVVTDDNCNVGFIVEVSINNGQPEPYQVSYSVEWMIGNEKTAWWNHKDLERHCNIFVKIARASCHPSGQGRWSVDRLMKTGI